MSRILKQTHASAQRLHAAGFLDAMTMREFDALCLPPVPTYSPEDVQRIRAASQASQAVFAKVLNVGTATVSAWEQGTKTPNGTAGKLLSLVERKGLKVLLEQG
jgi:putative transcriptional regulator